MHTLLIVLLPEPSRVHRLPFFQDACHLLGCLITIQALVCISQWTISTRPESGLIISCLQHLAQCRNSRGIHWRQSGPLLNKWPWFTLAKNIYKNPARCPQWHSYTMLTPLVTDIQTCLFGTVLTLRKIFWQDFSLETTKQTRVVMWTLEPIYLVCLDLIQHTKLILSYFIADKIMLVKGEHKRFSLWLLNKYLLNTLSWLHVFYFLKLLSITHNKIVSFCHPRPSTT